MSFQAWAIVLSLAVLVLPVLVYVCVKLGTVAFYRGRQTYFDDKEK